MNLSKTQKVIHVKTDIDTEEINIEIDTVTLSQYCYTKFTFQQYQVLRICN